MVKRIALFAAIVVSLFFVSQRTQAQFGGLQVQLGGYGYNSPYNGGIGYGNGFYNNRYGNGYSYGNYRQAAPIYRSGYSNYGYGYRHYPTTTYRYITTRNYAVPSGRVYSRRFR